MITDPFAQGVMIGIMITLFGCFLLELYKTRKGDWVVEK